MTTPTASDPQAVAGTVPFADASDTAYGSDIPVAIPAVDRLLQDDLDEELSKADAETAVLAAATEWHLHPTPRAIGGLHDAVDRWLEAVGR